MKPTLNQNQRCAAVLAARSPHRTIALIALLALSPVGGLRAADVIFKGSVLGSGSGTTAGSRWRTLENWEGGALPTASDNAVLGSNLDTLYNYLDFTGTTPIEVGCITLHADRSSHPNNKVLRNESGNSPLVVYGVDGVLITNASIKQLQFNQNGVNAPLVLLAGNGTIGGGDPAGNILFYSGIKETNGSFGFTKVGPNTLIFDVRSGNTPNTHTGPTTIQEGRIDLRQSASRLGSGPIVLAGGTLFTSVDRSAVAPLPGPVTVTADSTIMAAPSGTATFIFPFSGAFGGDAGGLDVFNDGASGSTFGIRLTGGDFDFTRPIMLSARAIGSRTVLQLQNPASAGAQKFSGAISYRYAANDPCRVERSGADGTTIFTGANTYGGGTLISQGTLLANNTTGSALGSGEVIVTNTGTLGGNGMIEAATTRAVQGGTISPGATANEVGTLRISNLTWGEDAVYQWQIASVSGVPGTAWDLIACDYWGDEASSTDPVTIKVDSLGTTPSGWNAAVARDWVILQSSFSGGFNPLNFAVSSTGFKGALAGNFGLYVDASGSLHLTYTPYPDLVINVAAGLSKTQTEAGHPVISGAQGLNKTGAGELILDNAGNDYQSSTKVLAGTLSIADSAANGMGTLGVSSSALYLGDTSGSAEATFNISAPYALMSRDLVVQAGSSGVKTISSTVTSGQVDYNGDLTLLDSAVLSAATDGTLVYRGDMTGDGGLTLAGGGTLTLLGEGTYNGPTTVNASLLNLNGPAFGTNTITYNNALKMDNTSGADVVLHTAPQLWSADIEFLGTGNLDLGAGPVTLAGNRTLKVDASTLVIGGAVHGDGGLTKTGLGILALRAATPSSYTGGTTNLEGTLALGSTATLGESTSPLVLAGGQLLFTGEHASHPLANPVILATDSVIVGTNNTSMNATFSGAFSNPGGHKLTIANKGWNTTTFGLRLVSPDNIDYPVVLGDPAFDRPAGGVTNQIQFYSTGSSVQMVSGLISGIGSVVRGNATPNTGGSTVLAVQNTFATAFLTGGALGFGASSISADGVITSGPIGTGLFTIGNQTVAETNMTVFAHGGARVIDNPIFLNGAQNVVIDGEYDLTFTGPIDAGGIPKKWTVRGTGIGTLAGQITSAAAGAPLTKAGSGTLVLSAENLYTGTTTVQQGTLLANNTAGSATGPNTVTVQSGATLGGTGFVAGTVTVNNGSVSPGQNGAGTLTLGNGANLANGGTYVWDLAENSTAPGSFDVLSITGGSVILDGTSQVLINFTGSATAPEPANPFWLTERTWTILTVTGSASNPGLTAFPTVVNGLYSKAGRFTTEADTSGNIVLTFKPGETPEPVISSDIEGIETGSPKFTWSAQDGVKYRLEYTTDLSQPDWQVVGEVTADGGSASITHQNSPWPQCFYRVVIR
jgi:autotransporter-associated beta strand protein